MSEIQASDGESSMRRQPFSDPPDRFGRWGWGKFAKPIVRSMSQRTLVSASVAAKSKQ